MAKGKTSSSPRVVAFVGDRCIAAGDLPDVAVAVQAAVNQEVGVWPLIFNAETSELMEVDLRGAEGDLRARLAEPDAASATSHAATARGPGRPKLGVVAREVTLLPRHWEWLSGQPGGASVALRKLVEEARRVRADDDSVRRAREYAYRFISAVAGNLPGFEEATRALFGGDGDRYLSLTEAWPADVRKHARTLGERCFPARRPG